MRNVLKLAFIGLIVFSSTHLVAQKADIKLKLKKGAVYTIKMEMDNNINQEMMGQSMHMTQKMIMTMNTKVVDVLANGNYQLEQTYKRVQLDMKMNGQGMTMDTDGDSNDPQTAALAKLKEAVITYEVSPNGTVSNLGGYDELMAKMGSNPQTAQMLKGAMSDDMMVNFFNYLPKEKIGKGDTYTASVKMAELMNMEVKTDYTVTGISSDQIDLNVSSDIQMAPEEPITQNGMSMKIKATGKQNGTFVVSRSDGMPKSSLVNQDMDMTMTMKNPQNGEDMTIPMKLNSVVTTTVTKN